MLLLLVSSVLSVSLYSVRFAAWYSLSQYIWSSSLLQGTCSQELRHGVSTIGDRIRLRDLCSRAVERADLEVPSVSTSRHREERLALINPRRKGFRPANKAPGMSSSVRITESFTALLEDAILRGFSSDKTRISYDKSPDSRYLNFPDFEMWPTKPRFHVLEPRLYRVSAIFE